MKYQLTLPGRVSGASWGVSNWHQSQRETESLRSKGESRRQRAFPTEDTRQRHEITKKGEVLWSKRRVSEGRVEVHSQSSLWEGRTRCPSYGMYWGKTPPAVISVAVVSDLESCLAHGHAFQEQHPPRTGWDRGIKASILDQQGTILAAF